MADYVKVKLVNGDTRHLPVYSGSRGSGMVQGALENAFGQITIRTVEGTVIVAAHIVEGELALDHEDIVSREHSEYL